MSPELQRIAIAEVCGWKVTVDEDVAFQIIHTDGRGCGGARDKKGAIMEAAGVPDYLSDLNAMHEAEKVLMSKLTLEKWNKHVSRLVDICGSYEPNPRYRIKTVGDYYAYAIHATAAQRAEAFLRTLNLWQDDAKASTIAQESS